VTDVRAAAERLRQLDRTFAVPEYLSGPMAEVPQALLDDYEKIWQAYRRQPMSDPTPQALADFIAAHRRIHGNPPKLKDCIDHFDEKKLNVLMCLWEAEASGLVKRADLRIVERKRGANQ
jgi:hypothetical protein